MSQLFQSRATLPSLTVLCSILLSSHSYGIVLTADNTNGGVGVSIQSILVEGSTYTDAAGSTIQADERALLERVNFSNGSYLDTSTFNNPLLSTTLSDFNGNVNLGVFTGDGGATRVALTPPGTTPETDSYLAAALAATEARNLRNYTDNNSFGASENFTLDFTYTNNLDPNGSILVGERDGNSSFSITALNAAGNPTGVVVEVPSGLQGFALDTGFQAAGDGNSGQGMEIAVFSVAIFAATEDIRGLRLFNENGADTFLLASSPTVVPEPSSFALIFGTVALGFVAVRRRSR
ncbi:MAG: PEP-CTERM sorting domain-containing protein [Opitutaceae bacterium]